MTYKTKQIVVKLLENGLRLSRSDESKLTRILPIFGHTIVNKAVSNIIENEEPLTVEAINDEASMLFTAEPGVL